MQLSTTLLLTLALATTAKAAIVTRTVDYQCGGTVCKGYLAYDDAATGQRPGVLVVHEYWGLNDFAKDRARDFAALGYVALAADMYGEGVVAKSPEEAGKLAGSVRGDRELMRARARAALEALASQPNVDPARLAALGYCFGGTVALELGYSGAPLRGVISIHGGLTAPTEADLAGLKASFLILHGGADPTVSAEQIKAMENRLNKAGADWQMIVYSGAKHAFTNPANTAPNPSAGYHEKAAKRSWEHLKGFLAEVLG